MVDLTNIAKSIIDNSGLGEDVKSNLVYMECKEKGGVMATNIGKGKDTIIIDLYNVHKSNYESGLCVDLQINNNICKNMCGGYNEIVEYVTTALNQL